MIIRVCVTACLLSLATMASAVDAELAIAGQTFAKLTLPGGWTAIQTLAKTMLVTPRQTPHIQLWVIAGAADVAQTTTQLTTFVTGEVTEFKAAKTEDLMIAGAPAKRVTGTGLEADDGDPSNAEITVFQVGSHVVLCISHGEGNGVAEVSNVLVETLAQVVAVAH